MTEQQADALMCYMDVMSEYGLLEELAALTALCRHRDRVVYEKLYNDYFDIEWYGNKTIFDWDLREAFMEMQTWK